MIKSLILILNLNKIIIQTKQEEEDNKVIEQLIIKKQIIDNAAKLNQ